MPLIKDLEGELTLDHRHSPGVPAEMMLRAGLPAQAGQGFCTVPIYTCSHCQRGVTVIVAAFGLREKRYVCSGCRKVLCEGCAKEKALTGVCKPYQAKVEDYLERVEKGHSLILLE